MAKPLPFIGQKISYLWRYRHDDMAVTPEPQPSQPADLNLQDFVCTCQAGVHPAQTNLAFSGCHSLMDVLRYLFRKVLYPIVTPPSWSFTAKVGSKTTVQPGTAVVTLTPSPSPLKYAGNECPTVTDNGTFSDPQYTAPGGSPIIPGGSYNFTLPSGAAAPQPKTFSATRSYTTGTTSPKDNTGSDCQKTDLANPPQVTYSGLVATAKITVDLPFFYGWADNAAGSPSDYLFQNSSAQTINIPAQQAANAKPAFFILIPQTHPSAVITLKNTSGNETDAQLSTGASLQKSLNGTAYTYSVIYFSPAETFGIPLKLTIKP
ncbi:MAG: hypothetical protein IJU81_02525 [Bacteroidales bacterium]|nr:hypothetical protein [Bacteroidales bacterium]